MTVLVLEHVAHEPAAAFGDVLRERGIAVDVVRLDRGDPLPDWKPFDGLLVMGGPMGARDDAAHPWLALERRLIRDAVGAGKAFLGVCLGAQLLAAGLGARVWTGPEPEIGMRIVERTPAGAADPVFATAGDRLHVLQWHGDSFDLPAGTTRLWTGRQYFNQGFRVGARAYGLQFHLEAPPELVRHWTGGNAAFEPLLADVDRHAAEMARHAWRTLERWIDGCLERRNGEEDTPSADREHASHDQHRV